MAVKTKTEYFYGLGRRKSAHARVRLISGKGKVVVNDKKISPAPNLVVEPLKLVGQDSKFDISAKVMGGGAVSQLQAIALGVARALEKLNPDFRKTLKVAGMLTRDPRAKERKKPGLKRARKAPQWSKR